MRAIEITCNHSEKDWNCEAIQGKPCRNKDTSGDFHPIEGYHDERIIDAAAMTGGAGTVEIPLNVIDRAAEDFI